MNADEPAFPWEQSPGNQSNLGLTKREAIAKDILAGMAAGSMWSDNFYTRTDKDPLAEAVKVAVHAADLLIAELSKP